jgi:cytochrome c biogenesis protein CcmG/thiol:disulfide interchange protein DsbE
VAVVALALIVVLAGSKRTGDSAESPLLGKDAPALSGQTLDGATFDLAAQQGKWVVVNFFGSWCVPCQQEAPELRRWATAHQAAGDALLVNVLVNDTPEKARAFLDEHGGATWPVVVTDTDTLGLRWGVAKVPETYLVTPSGVVVWKTIQPVTMQILDDAMAQVERMAQEMSTS